MDNLNIIIKVGKSSHIKLKNVKCHRAITFGDIDTLMSKYNPKVVIMDSVQSFEVAEAASKVSELTKNGISVFIYDCTGAEYAKQLADRSGTELATNLTELQHSISMKLATSVMTNWEEMGDIYNYQEMDYVVSGGKSDVKTIKEKSQMEESDTNEDSLIEPEDIVAGSEDIDITNKEQYIELQSLLDRVTEEKNRLKAEVEQKSTRVSELMEIMDSLEEQTEMYKGILEDIEKFEVKYKGDTGDYKKYTDEIDRLKDDIQNKEKIITQKEGIIDTITQEKNELLGRLQTSETAGSSLESKLKELEGINQTINATLIAYDSEKKDWESREKEYEEKAQSSLEKIQKLQDEISNYRSKINELNSKMSDYEELRSSLSESEKSNSNNLLQINSLTLEKSNLIKEQNELQTRIKELNAQVQNLKFMQDSSISNEEKELLDAKISNLEEELKAIRKKLDSEKAAKEIQVAMFNKSLSLIGEKDTSLSGRLEEVQNLKKSVAELRDQLKIKQEQYSTLNSQYAKAGNELAQLSEKSDKEREELNNQIGILTDKIAKLKADKEESATKSELDSKKIQGLEMRVMSLESTINDNKYRLEEAKKEKERLEAQLSEKSSEIEEYQEKLSEYESEIKAKNEEISKSRIAATQEANRADAKYNALDTTYKTIQAAMTKAVRELNDTKRKLAISESTNKKLEAAHSKLNNEYLELCKSKGVENKPMYVSDMYIRCNYSGKAKIIPVFGSGSYGVTSLSVAIARCIKGAKILLMDLDLSGGKMDVVVKKTPLISSLQDITVAHYRTSFGSFLSNGYEYFKQNKDKVIQPIGEAAARSRVDYFSGSIVKVNTERIASANFTSLMNDLGNDYDYIIVDLGKLAGSESSEALIKMFISISSKSLFVVLKEPATCRNAGIKLAEAAIDRSKVMWVLNMASTTALDDVTKKSIGQSKVFILPQDMQMYNQHKPLEKSQILRTKIAELAETITS